MSSAGQFELLRSRQFDIGFTRLPAPLEFPSRLVGRERLAFALPKVIASDWTTGTPAALAHLPFVLPARQRSAPVFDQVIGVLRGVSIYAENRTGGKRILDRAGAGSPPVRHAPAP